jgi:hypothetical protein
MLEMTCDVFEIGIGQALLLTNAIRPKSGRLWRHNEREVDGAEGISQLDSARAPEPGSFAPVVRGIEDLRSVLSLRQSLLMSRSEFLAFYRALPPSTYKSLMDPLALYNLTRDDRWTGVLFSRVRDQIGIVFQDGYGRSLQETFIEFSPRATGSPASGKSVLERDARFRGRVVPADRFLRAFDRLQPALQLQVVTDPSRLIIWGEDLVWIGIAAIVSDQSVAIAFEVRNESGSTVYEMSASEIAIEYLIAALNQIGGKPPLSSPEKEEGDR